MGSSLSLKHQQTAAAIPIEEIVVVIVVVVLWGVGGVGVGVGVRCSAWWCTTKHWTQGFDAASPTTHDNVT